LPQGAERPKSDFRIRQEGGEEQVRVRGRYTEGKDKRAEKQGWEVVFYKKKKTKSGENDALQAENSRQGKKRRGGQRGLRGGGGRGSRTPKNKAAGYKMLTQESIFSGRRNLGET